MTAPALVPAVLPGDDSAARLEALLDEGFLAARAGNRDLIAQVNRCR